MWTQHRLVAFGQSSHVGLPGGLGAACCIYRWDFCFKMSAGRQCVHQPHTHVVLCVHGKALITHFWDIYAHLYAYTHIYIGARSSAGRGLSWRLNSSHHGGGGIKSKLCCSIPSIAHPHIRPGFQLESWKYNWLTSFSEEQMSREINY